MHSTTMIKAAHVLFFGIQYFRAAIARLSAKYQKRNRHHYGNNHTDYKGTRSWLRRLDFHVLSILTQNGPTDWLTWRLVSSART
jgi:hypothetical protein